MRRFKLTAAMTLIAALCLGFSSCGSDDENPENTQPPYGQDGTGTDGSQDPDDSESPVTEPEEERDEDLNPIGTTASVVDMGLSVNWASHNVGASGTYDCGGAYGWGDAQGTCYSKDLGYYPSANPPLNITGTEYDIARAKWGSPWRMPTVSEFQELIDNCDVEWNGSLNVLVFKSKVNGNQLIFPATQYRSGKNYYTTTPNREGHYWTSTLATDNADEALEFGFFADNMIINAEDRYVGVAVRPVQTNADYVPGGDMPDIPDTPATPEEMIVGKWTIYDMNDTSWKYEATFSADGTCSITQYYDIYGDMTYAEYDTSYNGIYTISDSEIKIITPNPGYDLIGGTYTIVEMSDKKMRLQMILDGSLYEYNCIKQ